MACRTPRARVGDSLYSPVSISYALLLENRRSNGTRITQRTHGPRAHRRGYDFTVHSPGSRGLGFYRNQRSTLSAATQH